MSPQGGLACVTRMWGGSKSSDWLGGGGGGRVLSVATIYPQPGKDPSHLQCSNTAVRHLVWPPVATYGSRFQTSR